MKHETQHSLGVGFRWRSTQPTKSWGSKLLAKIRARGKPNKISPGQKSLWDEWDAHAEEIRQVAEKFVLANCFDPQFASRLFSANPENNTG